MTDSLILSLTPLQWLGLAGACLALVALTVIAVVGVCVAWHWLAD